MAEIQKYYFASMYPGVPEDVADYSSRALPTALAETVIEIEAKLQMPVWLLLQDGKETPEQSRRDSYNTLGGVVSRAFFRARHSGLQSGQPIALLIDSPGGQARQTYELAMLLRRHCGGFIAVIPRHAKSAATLLALGANEIVFNRHAEMGPLDVQVWDAEREEWLSGLDEVKTLERLHASAMEAFDRMMLLLMGRTGKKMKSLIPVASTFVTQLMQPMLQGIDVVKLTQMSRLLSVAEEYAKRLLEDRYGKDGGEIASFLGPVNSFVSGQLGMSFACRLGHPSFEHDGEVIERLLPVVDRLAPFLGRFSDGHVHEL